MILGFARWIWKKGRDKEAMSSEGKELQAKDYGDRGK